jgi:hypothetical protein
VQAPEDVFLIIDVFKHQRNEEVVALVVEQLTVDIAVSKKHIMQLFLVWLIFLFRFEVDMDR